MSEPHSELNAPESARSTPEHNTILTREGESPVRHDDVCDPCVVADSLSSNKFKDRYPNPFTTSDKRVPEIFQGRYSRYWGDTARTIVELRMCALSSSIRDKPCWYVKMQDPSILAEWREEALAQVHPVGLRKEWALTEQMVDYVLAELVGYATLRDETTGVEVACYERVWKSDSLVSDDEHTKLLRCVAELEDVPAEEQDWHPGPDGQVLNLVHPSLYPIVYYSTLSRDPATGSVQPLRGPESAHTYRSNYFAWLPSEFSISNDGTASLVSPYINNIHPKRHADLYPVMDRLVTLAVPLFERVLSDLRRPLSKQRIVTQSEWCRVTGQKVHAAGCIWKVDEDGNSIGPPSPTLDTETGLWDDEDYPEWLAAQTKRLPEALPSYDNALERIRKTVSLSGSTLQIIVKMVNIVLTPEKSTYGGGPWRVEGMENEGIVSTFIYCYDEENVTESRLAFRTSVIEPAYHGMDEHSCMKILYNLGRDVGLVQDLGDVVTSKGRCIAFPNTYQHQVQPFQLKDSTKPGHRKILTFFLIDPGCPVPSATTIPPQQRDWVADTVYSGLGGKDLPVELMDAITSEVEGVITKEQAEEIRLELMEERSKMAETLTEEKYNCAFYLWQ